MSLKQTFHKALAARDARERRLLALAGVLLLAAALWLLSIAPALSVLRAAPAQLELLDTQWHAMQRAAAEAKRMQERQPMARDEALRALEASVRQCLGTSAELRVVGERVTVTFKGAAPESLAQWLELARVSARMVPAQARLSRGATGWDGSIVLNLQPAP